MAFLCPVSTAAAASALDAPAPAPEPPAGGHRVEVARKELDKNEGKKVAAKPAAGGAKKK